MCRLWMTKPSRSLRPNYFVIEDFAFSMEGLRTELGDLGYEFQTSIDSTETGLTQVDSEGRALLLATPEIEGKTYIAGLVTPYLKQVLPSDRQIKALKVVGFAFILYIGGIIGIALFGLGWRGEERPYYLEFLAQNWLPIILVGAAMFLPIVYLTSMVSPVNIHRRNYQVAEEAYSDLKAALERLCPTLETETFGVPAVTYLPWHESAISLPLTVKQGLEELVTKIEGFVEAGGSIADLDVEPPKSDTYHSY